MYFGHSWLTTWAILCRTLALFVRKLIKLFSFICFAINVVDGSILADFEPNMYLKFQTWNGEINFDMVSTLLRCKVKNNFSMLQIFLKVFLFVIYVAK